ncbi:hypothetical protein MBLNU459_g4425t1 [Dothideomycetes sp. NU459]
MSSRSRPRANHSQDADEERRLWEQIRDRAKRIDDMVARSAEIGTEIVDVEKQQAALVEADSSPLGDLDEQLEKLYRENVKISEEVQHIIEGKSDDMNLLDSIKLLAALREASEESSQVLQTRGPVASSKRSTTLKRKGGSAVGAEEGEESAAPSPRVASRDVKDKDRLAPSREKVRGGSVPSTREVSVKIEDGAESVASSVEAPSENSRRLTLNLGAMVFYRNKGRAAEGEGILCRVTNVIGEGKQRRYEIQDADPDPAPGTGEPPAPYRASVAHLVPVPSTNGGLPDLVKGKHVLAQYPDTTTFYKAEVSTAWRAKDLGTEKGELVRLRFEGEMEETKETEVERRFVLVEK